MRMLRSPRRAPPNPATTAEAAELRAANLKITRARLLVLRFLREQQGRHLSAEAIHKQLLRDSQKLAIATVYRVLADFEKAGMVASSQFDAGPAVYELNGRRRHDHMVCTETGAVHEFADSEAEQHFRERATAMGYELTGYRLVLFVRPGAPSQ